MSVLSKWDERYLALAKEVSTWSKDPSTQVGAVTVGSKKEVLSQGFNTIQKRTMIFGSDIPCFSK
jgi:dCMP deaminase